MQLIHGDCLEKMKDIPDHSVDMVLCDLPYGATSCEWDTIIDSDVLFNEYSRIVKFNRPIILFSQNPFTAELVHSFRDRWSHEYTWIKNTITGFQRSNSQPLKVKEDIEVFYNITPINGRVTSDSYKKAKEYLIHKFKISGLKSKDLNKLCGFEATGYLRMSSSWANILPQGDKLNMLANVLNFSPVDFMGLYTDENSRTYNPQNTIECNKVTKRGSTGSNWANMKVNVYRQVQTNYPVNVLFFDKEPNGVHSAQKPIKLLEYLILTYTNEGETVLDNCMGSGSTGVACINTNRNFIGIEKDDKYFEIAKKRIEEHLTTAST